MEISNIIRETRCVLGLTQKQLAERIGSNRSAIANYETGRIMPKADVFLKIQSLKLINIPQECRG